MKKIIAVASEGGHWKQLSLLSEFFCQYETHYVTTNKGITLENYSLHYINDANKDNKLALLKLFFNAFILFRKIMPDTVITTGAAPGLAMLIMAKFHGKKGIWIDSIANAEELSLSGKLAKRFATITLSQWESVAAKEGVVYKGSLL